MAELGMQSLLTEVEVANILGVAVPTLRNWRHLGKGPRFLKVGQRIVRYRRDDIEAFLQAGLARRDAYSADSGHPFRRKSAGCSE